jgi:putative hydrolase of the HAD superfamily
MIRHLLFDLDDTLYPPSSGAGKKITGRMVSYIARCLEVSEEEAARIRRERMPFFGTTLEWLQTEYQFAETDAYFDWVHPESEITDVPLDPRLRPFLRSLNLPMTILTNGPMSHAVRVLERLQVADLFPGIYDICRNNLLGKPHENSYMNALNSEGFTIEETVFFDDNPKYVAGYEKLGGRAVLVSSREKNIALLPRTPHVGSVYEIRGWLEKNR